MKLITTKIIPPSVAVGLLERPRLSGLLAEVLRVRITLVRAPAGYGKTSQMMMWHTTLLANGTAVCWVSFDPSDRDGFEILSYLAAALEGAGIPMPAINGLMATDGSVSTEVALAALIDDLLVAKQPIVMFLDDLHVLKSQGPLRTLAQFIAHAPANLHFVLASREEPNLPLARSRVQGSCLEVTTDELRFSENEMASFMAMNGHADLDVDTIGALEDCTEGWAAGLRLACLVMTADADAGRMLATFTGGRRAVADYFAQDVLAHYSPEVQDFLFDTCILERLCPDLCDALTGRGNGRRILDQIEASGLFLFSLDNDRTWYRYHHLFAEFLRRRASDSRAAAIAELHRRASRWLFAAGFHVEAFEHAMQTGDLFMAAGLLDRCCLSTFYGGQVRTLLTLAERIPHEILIQFPRVTLTKAWTLIIQWQFDEARPLLVATRRRLDSIRAEGASPDELAELEYLLLHREMMLAQFEDDMPLVARQCRELLAVPIEADAYVSGTLYTSLIFAEREQFRLSETTQMAVRAISHFRRSGSRFVIVWHQSIVGPTRLLAGSPDMAFEALQEGFEAASAIAGPFSPLAAMPSLLRAEVHYERNDLEEAERLCTTYLPMAGELGFIDQLVAGYLTRARLFRLDGDVTAAAATLDEGLEAAKAKGFDRLARHLWCERITHLLRDGRNAEALALVQRHQLVPREPVLPLGTVTTKTEIEAVLWVRVALVRNKVRQAINVAGKWRAFTERAGAIRSTIRWDILLAQALMLHGDMPAAQRSLRRAVANAGPGRFIRCFLDEGVSIIHLLSQTYGPRPTAAEGFAGTLLQLARPHEVCRHTVDLDPEMPREALNPREIEILLLVDAGMLNKEIGLRLGITEGSVKWYLQQIYDKLGTRRRSVAVQWARQLGLLSGQAR